MSRRAIRYIGHKAGLHPIPALLVVAIATGLAVWAAVERLTVEMDIAALLPKDSEVYQQINRADSLFGLGNYDFLLCVLEVKDDAPNQVKADSGAFLKSVKDEIEDALDDQRYFRRKTDRLQPRRTLEVFRYNDPAKVAMLTPADLDRLEEEVLPQAGLEKTIGRIAAEIQDRGTTASLEDLSRDPFGVDELLLSKLNKSSGPLKSSYRDGAYLSEDGRMMLIVMWPVNASTNLVEAREVMRFLLQTKVALYERNPSWRAAMNIDFVGPHVESAEGTSDVRQDIFLTSIVSLIGVLFLFIVAFRQPEALIFVAIPLVVGVLWTLGIASLIIPRITQVTLIFAAILIGLGIDFSIHLYNRYLEGIRGGASPETALGDAIMHTGPSIVAGGITTGFAFFGMALTRFQGFRELGIFGGIGILMCLLAVALVLPPLMMLFTRPKGRLKGPLATLGLKKITFVVQSYPRMTVAGGLCIVTFLGIHATRATFNEDFRTLRQPSINYQKLLERIDEHFDLPTNQVLVIVEEKDLAGALAANDQVFQNIDSARVRFDLIGVDTLRRTYPSVPTQRESLSRFLRIIDPEIEREITWIASQHPEIPRDFFDPTFARLTEIRETCATALASPVVPVDFSRIDDQDFLDVVRSYLAHDPATNVYSIVTRIYPPSTPEWQESIPPVFLDSIEARLNQKPKVLGNAVISARLQDYIINDLAVIVLVVFVSVSIYLAFHFRSFIRAGLAMIPVFFAVLSMLGVMHILGLQLNYLNVIALPMIVGIGVDSAIHLLARFYEDDRRNMRLAIEKTGRAIVITGLTTIFGFGALSIASFRGLREIGFLAIVGTICTLLATLVFLPAVLKLLDPKYTFRGGSGDEIG